MICHLNLQKSTTQGYQHELNLQIAIHIKMCWNWIIINSSLLVVNIKISFGPLKWLFLFLVQTFSKGVQTYFRIWYKVNDNVNYLGETIVRVSSSTELSLEFFEL